MYVSLLVHSSFIRPSIQPVVCPSLSQSVRPSKQTIITKRRYANCTFKPRIHSIVDHCPWEKFIHTTQNKTFPNELLISTLYTPLKATTARCRQTAAAAVDTAAASLYHTALSRRRLSHHHHHRRHQHHTVVVASTRWQYPSTHLTPQHQTGPATTVPSQQLVLVNKYERRQHSHQGIYGTYIYTSIFIYRNRPTTCRMLLSAALKLNNSDTRRQGSGSFTNSANRLVCFVPMAGKRFTKAITFALHCPLGSARFAFHFIMHFISV